MPRKLFPIFFTFAILLISLTACVSLAEDITPPPGYQAPTALQNTPTSEAPVYPMLPPDPLQGAPLYAEKCAPCHGAAGLGDGPDAEKLSNPVPPLGDPALARLAAPDDWYLMVTNGNMQNFMPPFTSLSVPERWDVIAYVYTLSTTPAELNWGQGLYAENCAACHGERGQGDGPEAGSLSASPIDFTDQEFMGARSAADLFKAITDGLGEMHSFADLPEADRWALTAFLRTLTFAEPEPELAETPEAYPGPEAYPAPEETLVETPVQGDSEPTVEPETKAGPVMVSVISASGGALPSGIEITLYGFEGMTQVYSQTLPLASDGTVQFENIPLLLDQFIFATIEYDNVSYGSDIAVVEAETTSLDLAIPYYEQTTELSILKAERLHVFYEFINPASVQVYVLYIFSNDSDQVLIAQNPEDPAVTFTLPEGAFNLEWDTGMEFRDVETANGFGLTVVYPSIEPFQVLYSFEMPYENERVDFDLPIALDTTAVIVMAPEDGVRIRSDQLTDAGMRDIEGVSFSIYNGSNLQAGDLLNMVVSGRSKASSAVGETGSEDSSTGLVIGLMVFGVMLIGTGLYLWQRNRSAETDGEDGHLALDAEMILDSSEDLMDAIIALDDLYKAGEIPTDAYQKRRAELKERLQKLIGDGA